METRRRFHCTVDVLVGVYFFDSENVFGLVSNFCLSSLLALWSDTPDAITATRMRSSIMGMTPMTIAFGLSEIIFSRLEIKRCCGTRDVISGTDIMRNVNSEEIKTIPPTHEDRIDRGVLGSGGLLKI